MIRKIIQEYELTDMVNEYINDFNAINPLNIGTMVGADTFRIIMNAAIGFYPYIEILILQGCQDMLGFCKNQSYNNHLYYLDIFRMLYERRVDRNRDYEIFFGVEYDTKIELCLDIIDRFNIVIVNDAHLIPRKYIEYIKKAFNKVILIYDVFEKDLDYIHEMYTLTESFIQLSPIIANARALYGVETRYINRKLEKTNVVSTGKMSPRSFGRNDKFQHISDDPDVIKFVRDKQIKSGFRKNQMLFITDDKIQILRDPELRIGEYPINKKISRNSLITLGPVLKDHLSVKAKIYFSNNIVLINPTYDKTTAVDTTSVVPANILDVEQQMYHRYKQSLFIPSGKDIPKSVMYSLCKNTNRLVIINR